MKHRPSLNGGRESDGRFAKGNPGGPGNPLAKRANKVRVVLLSSVTEEDLRKVVRKLLSRAKRGDIAAIREVLDRCMGKSVSFSQLREVEEELCETRFLQNHRPEEDQE